MIFFSRLIFLCLIAAILHWICWEEIIVVTLDFLRWRWSWRLFWKKLKKLIFNYHCHFPIKSWLLEIEYVKPLCPKLAPKKGAKLVYDPSILDYQKLPKDLILGFTKTSSGEEISHRKQVLWKKVVVEIFWKGRPGIDTISHAIGILFHGSKEFWYDISFVTKCIKLRNNTSRAMLPLLLHPFSFLLQVFGDVEAFLPSLEWIIADGMCCWVDSWRLWLWKTFCAINGFL